MEFPKYFYFRVKPKRHGTAVEIEDASDADVVEVVRCKDCKYRIVNEHYGEKGYMRIKAMCKFESDIFELRRRAEEDDWFCADGERNDT